LGVFRVPGGFRVKGKIRRFRENLGIPSVEFHVIAVFRHGLTR